MSIPASFIQELLSRVDVVEVVGRYVQLKKGGANFMGLCPFHGEKSPSFSVSPSKQFYHCFGCGANGNALGFLMEHTGVGFVDAVKDLASQVGLTVPDDDSTPQERAQAAQARQHQATLTEVLARAAADYVHQLKGSSRAIAYLKGRGLTGQIAKTFGLGYAPSGWHHLSAVFPDYQSSQLVEAGLVIAAEAESQNNDNRRYDRFRDRIMFPIRNVKGECIGFGARVLDQGEPKYLNSPETPVFSKGRELYGLFEARAAIRQHGYALVTEGYMDVVALAQLGFGNAVATLGTACTADHVRKLFRFTDSVVFSFDGDAAGRRAARKALDASLPFASDTRSVRFLFLPPEHDPDSFIRAEGTDAFARCVREATPLSRFLVESASADADLQTAEGRARLGAQAQPLWLALPDGTFKRQLLHELADLIGLDAQDLRQLWETQDRHAPRSRAPRREEAVANTNPPPATRRRHAPEDEARSSWSAPTGTPRRDRPRPASNPRGIARREDRALGLLLGEPTLWETLSADDHAMLAHLPAPHGPLFAWLEAQWHEHGAQPWAVLREALRGHPDEAFASAQVLAAMDLPDAGAAQTQEVLRPLRIASLMQRENEALEAGDFDRYRRLLEERRSLQTGLALPAGG